VNDVWRRRQRKSLHRLTEDFTGLQVHLVIHQPKRDLGNSDGPFEKFDTVELIDINDRKELLAAGVNRELANDVDLQKAQLAISKDEEIATAACRIEELE
jgi:hypothetical protein